jgi:hypothetical protein
VLHAPQRGLFVTGMNPIQSFERFTLSGLQCFEPAFGVFAERFESGLRNEFQLHGPFLSSMPDVR